MKKIFICLSIFALCFSLLACDDESSEQKDPDTPIVDDENGSYVIPNYTGDNIDINSSGYVQGSIHQYNVTETSNYVVQNNQTQYKILVPSDASFSLTAYALEFSNLFFEATNVRLEIIDDSQFDSNGKYISLGDTKLFEECGILLDYTEIKSQGFVIKTIGDSIFMAGFSDEAVSNATYQYMNMIADYLYLGPDTYIINNVSEVKLGIYDIIDAPDIEHVAGSYSFVSSARKYRIGGDLWIDVNSERYHNSFSYLPKAKYEATHPEWYSTDGTQLCYTARGNEESLALMQETVFEVMKEHLIKFPTKTAIQFGIQDRNTFCDCPTCTESYKNYNGSNAALIVKFLNVISDKVNEWFEGEGAAYKRDLKITFFAYLSTNTAPAKLDSTTGKYVPIDESVICRPNVCPFFADIRGDYTKSYYDQSSANKNFANNMKAWTSCCDNVFFWTYQTNFHYYLTPYNCFDAMVDSYKFAVECGVTYLFDQAQFGQGPSATGWSFLKQYITARASWNCNIPTAQLYDEFFSEWYSKEASSVMRQLFDEYLVVARYQNNILGYTGYDSIYHNALQEKYWSKQTLIRWIELFDDALEEIEVYKDTNSDKYTKYYNHIVAERVQYSYILLKVFSSSMSEEEILFYKNMFYSDVETTGILKENEFKNTWVTGIFD